MVFCSGYRKPYKYTIDAGKDAFYHNNVGLNYLKDRIYYAAIQEFKIAIQLSPNTQATAIFKNNLGETYNFIGYPDMARVCFEDAIKLYVDKGIQEDYETEVFMDIQLKHYPLNDYQGMWAEMKNIVKDYSKVGKRNRHAIEHNKLGKHMCHLVRLYLMCFDILEKAKLLHIEKMIMSFLWLYVMENIWMQTVSLSQNFLKW